MLRPPRRSQFDYNIVAFVGVTVFRPDRTNQEIYAQPCAVINPDVVFKAGALRLSSLPVTHRP